MNERGYAPSGDAELSVDGLVRELFDGVPTFDDLSVTGLGLILLVLFAFVLFALLAGLRSLLALIPMSKSRRAALARARPMLEGLVTLVYLLLAIPIVFKAHSSLILTVLFFGMFAVLWSPLRDLISGTFIKAGSLCEVGDRVTVDGQSGVVKDLGYRTLTLESDDGTEIHVPYGRLSHHSIVRTPRVEGVYSHGFELALPPELDPAVGITRIKQLAMSSHWSSLVREPEIEPLRGGTLQVHVFALGHEHGPAIEALVRRGLAGS